ncbi:MAG: amidase [Acidobacteriota bacterium]|nr:amidase [Acidobacteriota bacterium]
MIRTRRISSVELITAHLDRIKEVNPKINAAVEVFSKQALADAQQSDAKLAVGERCGPLHGVPFSVKDSIDVKGARTTAGTVGRKGARPTERDATLVARLRAAGGIPIAKTNLPDLLFSFETDNLIYGRTNNPYDLTRTPGGSSGGESALIAACGSPLGLGSDALGSVRLPAAFCGIASIKPTSGRLPRTGHVPPAGGWIEALWQIGPMARHVEDLQLAMELLAGPDGADFTSPPVPLGETGQLAGMRAAFFTSNGFAPCAPGIEESVKRCAQFLSRTGMRVEERRPPGVETVYELELSLLGADGCKGIDEYLRGAGSNETHPFLNAFVDRMRPHRVSAVDFARRWEQWDEYRTGLDRFFGEYDIVLCPVYPQTALAHGGSLNENNFRGFSYTMAWSVGGLPAATVRCGEENGLPINVQVVAGRWRDMTGLAVCRAIEEEFGGWKAPPSLRDRNK